MAIFERNVQDKVIIDDTKPFIFEFKETETVNGHTEYTIELCREPDIEDKWVVKHRYSDFARLHATLKTPTIDLPVLPPKKVFGNTDKDFINNRKESLKEYLDKLLQMPYVANSLHVRKFLDPENYEGNYLEEARQNLLIALRSGGSHELACAISSLGTRIRKYNFLGYPLSNPRTIHILWWAPFGPDRNGHIRDIHSALTALVQCKHNYIVSSISCVATESGVCVIKPWFPQGSLRDYIYGVKPNFDSSIKYTNNKRRDIPMKTCAVYGRQILEAISFLHKKGVAHGAIHTGNVVIENNVCRLLDLENQVIGLPHLLRHHMTKIKKINSMEAIDIYSFGHLMYEMVFHNPLKSEFCDNFSPECSPLCRSVLESILSTEACKNGLPSASALLTHPFFNEVPLHSYEKPSLKLSPSVKETLHSTYETILKRLKEDQKKIKLRRQRYRAEAILSGEVIRTKGDKSFLNKQPDVHSAYSENQATLSESVINNSITKKEKSEESLLENEVNLGTHEDKIFPSVVLKDEGVSSSSPDGSSTPTSSAEGIPSTPPTLRKDLLSSISNFNKKNLRKCEANKH